MAGVHDPKQGYENLLALKRQDAVIRYRTEEAEQQVLDAYAADFLAELTDLCRRHKLCVSVNSGGELFVATWDDGDEQFIANMPHWPAGHRNCI